MNRRAVLLFTSAALTMLCIDHASARRGLRFSRGIIPRGAKVYNTGTLTQAQLEQCLLEEEKIENLEERIAGSKTEIDKLESRLSLQRALLESRRSTLNRYSQAEVDQFNRLVTEFERERLAFNNAVNSHNAHIEQGKRVISSFNLSCANRQYYEDDMQAAKAAVAKR